MIVAHDIRHALKANQQITADGLRRRDTSEAGACCELKGNVKPDVEVLGPGIGIGLRKEDTALKDKMNAAIKAIRANGTYDAFSKKYFDFDIYGG